MGLKWYSDSGAASITTTTTANTEVYAKVSFKDADVRALYIDWDDGTSNKKSESNYQWVELTEPLGSVVVPHTYNKTSPSPSFNPCVQTINSDGIASRYWSNEATGNYDGILSPVSQDSGVRGMIVNDNKATGIMRVQSRNVLSGIDNSLLEREGPHDIFITIPPTLTDTEILYAPSPINIKIKALVSYATAGGTAQFSAMPGQNETGYDLRVFTQSFNLPTTTGTMTGNHGISFGQGSSVAKVLSVQYTNPKLTGSDATNYTKNEALNDLKIFVTVQSRDEDVGTMYPITYVSAGSPYKSVEDSKRYITMDFSQSRPSAANVTNSYYFYDNGKGFFGADYQRWGDADGALDSGKFTASTKTSSATKTVHYTYNPRPQGVGAHTAGLVSSQYTLPFGTGSDAARTNECNWWYTVATNTATKERSNQFVVDDFGRFFPTQHLVRNSVEPSSGVAYTSSLSGNNVTIARITPVIDFSKATSIATMQRGSKFDAMQTTPGTALSGCYTASYTTPANNNNDTNATGLVSCSGMNTALFGYWDEAFGSGTRTYANEYFICLWDAKTNEIFFQCTPWWNGMQAKLSGNATNATGLSIAGVSYLRVTEKDTPKQMCEWVPLDFKDTTKAALEYRDTSSETYTTVENSLVMPGYISFDMPLDWGKIKMEGLYGGLEPGTSNAADDASGSLTTSVITVTGSVPGTLHAQYGASVTLDSAAGVITGSMSGSSLTSDDIGSFNYMAEILTDSEDDLDLQNLWVTKVSANNEYTKGYVDGTDQLFLQYGNSQGTHYADPDGTNVMTTLLRRINFYEVFPGCSKLFTDAGSSIMLPVDAGVAAAFPNQYGFEDYTTATAVGKILKDAWYGTDKYPLLITLSGNLATASIGGGGDAFHPEIWNVIDATQGFGAVINETDDSAYNLNSIPITSDISIGRGSNFYSAITRKGKTFITKTGIQLQEVGFTSVALGDETGAAISTTPLGSTYDYLHKMRRIQAEAVRVYWDEKQKDGTYVRFWGFVKDIHETRGVGGPRAIMNYTFTVVIAEIALLDVTGKFMTDIFPLGGVENERNYS